MGVIPDPDAVPSLLPEGLRFVHPWRSYQARVLHELDRHLSDDHLHIVAAPGAGKTILGLEVIRRLGRKSLVVVPTITIRSQWINRFRTLFEAPGEDHARHIGHRLSHPATITVTTYQALYSGLKEADAASELLAGLVECGTLVLDEAHHLRNEWWKALNRLKEALGGVQTVSLTATPPYDVSAAEWNRYFTLCGPIDAEVSIPELVAAENLCPHQDYVHFSMPSETERRALRTFRDGVGRLKTQLLGVPEFTRAVLGNPRFANFDGDRHREAILSDPEPFSAMVIFLCAAGFDCREQRAFLGVADEPVPPLDERWLETLLTDFLYINPELYDASDAYRQSLHRALAAIHAVERRRVKLTGNERLIRALRASDSKLDSVKAIVDLESAALGPALRLVILTSYVRRELLATEGKGKPGKQLGAVPIFELLRAGSSGAATFCLLTGSLVILPRTAAGAFLEALKGDAGEAGVPLRIPLPTDDRYVLFNVNDTLRQRAVRAVTALFERGEIRVIVGTTALLGEGWDAQSANTLIMADPVSSFVQTNQMRGRVIRIDPRNLGKVSNIWHIACVEPQRADGGADVERLQRRFATFEGVNREGASIESGFGRIFDAPREWSAEAITVLNRCAAEAARERASLAKLWRDALREPGSLRRNSLVEEIRAPAARLQRTFWFHRPYGAALRRGSVVLAGAGLVALMVQSPLGWLAAGGVGVFLAVAVGLPRRLHDAWRVWRAGLGTLVLRDMGRVVVDTLADLERLDTPRKVLRVVAEASPSGGDRCYLAGGTYHDSDRFIGCLEALLEPIENPRYLIVQGGPWPMARGRGSVRAHAVPAIFDKKVAAEAFATRWRKHMGRCRLVSTRSKAGRQTLLYARAKSWVNAGVKYTERVNRWR